MAVKMGNKLVLLCSTAIGLIYSAGYIATEPSATQNSSEAPPYVMQQPNKNMNNQTQDSSTTKKQGKYQDGTYHGSGSNHIGSVEVAVTIKNSKISSAEITNCTTSYPQSDIDGLPQQVVQRQSANVDFVSGATKSSEDFQAAVEEALQQAQNA
jgi:uncharacterized protein with FMN-binding domain